ncbi:cytokine receptor common subunit gamma-like [Mugil cephalus]|uniref:cytokine receptor common subunit gamma-like n=1 Tax=Mugil cephalus TaxID=48193 RepID=UPI001FB8393C|nr:cytokine receptor common subunit gamma-like [Mugil cephalus]XP_047464050.1 cytokine receptor common subunit gamma-like [Mugil cephalus]
MATRLLLLLCLIQHVFALPDVKCLVVNLERVECHWNSDGIPEDNYIFTSRFHGKTLSECQTYVREGGRNVGCIQPYTENLLRFNTFTTWLSDNVTNKEQDHLLKEEVKLNPPTNLTVQNGSDSNLHFYWNMTKANCARSEVRYRKNDRNWETSAVSLARTCYCINLPSKNSRYELQVRSKLDNMCGESKYWSDWSEPVVWGFNNSTDPNVGDEMSVWMPVLSVMGGITLVLLVLMLLHNERRRIILIPAPKLSLIPPDLEDWFEFPKGLKESFKSSYTERACPVREYCYVSQSSSDCSGSSVTTDQTDCSITVTEPEDPAPPASAPSDHHLQV